MRSNTFIKPSTIHGLGLFAAVDIPKGKEIIQGNADYSFIDEWIQYKKNCRKISFNFHTGYCMINHSSTPNTLRNNKGISIAAYNIKSGEEITEDYYKLPDNDNPFIGGIFNLEEIWFSTKMGNRLR